jgi:hypothetical protein
MWKIPFALLATVLALPAQTIQEFLLDSHKVIDLPVSREVTTVTLPGALTGLAGAGMLIEDGGAAGTDTEETAPLRFHVTHVKGSNFFLVQSLQPVATATLTALFEGAAYVFQLRAVASDPVASAILQRPAPQAAVRVQGDAQALRFSPRAALSLLDRARAYPVLIRSLPKAVEGVSLRAQDRKVDLPDIEIHVQEVYRFSKEDAVVFLLSLRNKTDQTLDVAPSTFAARIGNERLEQSIANGPRSLAPGESREAEFAIVGMPDGTRNDLSADNAFTILVNASPHNPELAVGSSEVTPPGGPAS